MSAHRRTPAEVSAREPLLNRAVWTALAGLAVSLGLITTDVADQLVVVLVAVAPIVAALWGRKVVTPLADPRDAQGRALTPDAPAEQP